MDTIIEVMLLLLEKLFDYRKLKKEQEELNIAHKSHTTCCTDCSKPISSLSVFCPHCMHLVPQVKEMLQKYPDKQPHEFLKLSYEGLYKCPHCGTKPISTDHITVKTPIIRCPNCHHFFLDVSIPEPYINKKPNRLENLFSIPLTICLVTLAIALFTNMSFWSWLSISTVVILIHTLFFKKDTSDDYSKSKMRVKRNPDYLQCLADMGYLHKMTPKFRNLTSYASSSVTCECCNNENVKENTHCSFCSAPLPTINHTRTYIFPAIDTAEYESLSMEFLLKLCIAILIFLSYIIFVLIKTP